MNRRSAVTVTVSVTVLMAGAVLAACDRDGGQRLATPSPTSAPTAMGSIAEPESAPADGTSPRSLPGDASLNGFAAIDPDTGDVTLIWLGSDRMWDINIYPGLTSGRDAIWLSWDNGTEDAVRFDLDGHEVRRVPGLWAKESPGGAVVLYYTAPSEYWHLIAQYPDRTVDLGVACCGVARDDGRIAFLGPSGEGGHSLRVYDPATDGTWVIAEGIGRPGKDGVIYPTWSPSGRFISDYSFDQAAPERSYWVLADTATGEVIIDVHGWTWQRGPNGEDWLGTVVDGDLVYQDPATGDERLRLSVPGAQIVYGWDLGGAIGIATGTREGAAVRLEHRLAFDLDGNELARWGGSWHISMTADGPAAIRGIAEADCQAIEVEHPRFEASLPCSATDFHWSPDGRFLAYRVEHRMISEIRIIELATGDTLTYETGHLDVSIDWNRDGSRLVIRLGVGI